MHMNEKHRLLSNSHFDLLDLFWYRKLPSNLLRFFICRGVTWGLTLMLKNSDLGVKWKFFSSYKSIFWAYNSNIALITLVAQFFGLFFFFQFYGSVNVIGSIKLAVLTEKLAVNVLELRCSDRIIIVMCRFSPWK